MSGKVFRQYTSVWLKVLPEMIKREMESRQRCYDTFFSWYWGD